MGWIDKCRLFVWVSCLDVVGVVTSFVLCFDLYALFKVIMWSFCFWFFVVITWYRVYYKVVLYVV